MHSKRKRSIGSDPPPVQNKLHLGTVSLSDGDSEVDEEPSKDAAEDRPADNPVAEGDVVRLLGLDFSLTEELRAIHALVRQPIAEGDSICHLRDVPENAVWSSSNTLTTPTQRAIVIVAFGSLASFQLSLARRKATTLTVTLELFCDEDKEKLQMIYDLGQPGRHVATREIQAHWASPDARSRLLNVYDRTGRSVPKHKVCPLSVNELLGGDVIRMEMRCVRVLDGDRFRVEFKLKSVHLVVAIPRGVDVMR